MNNGLKPSKITVNIETMPFFSTSIADMRITPVTRVVLGTPEAEKKPVRLEVSVVGRVGETEFIKRRDFVKDCFSSESYNLRNSSYCVLDFDFDSFEYNYAYLNSIEADVLGEIYVRVKYAGEETVAKTHVSLMPSNVWAGLDGEPSVVAAFLRENDAIVEKICGNVCESGEKLSYSTDSRKSLLGAVKKLYTKLKECNMIYTRPALYAANSRQRIRFPDELFGSGSVLATPLEIALVFSACVRRIGLESSLMFVRGRKGDISVLCGVYLVKSPIKVAVCEDAARIRDLVDAGDMLIVDPSVFAAAQNTSFVMALENTAEGFVNNYQSLVCLIDIKRALESAGFNEMNDELSNVPVKSAVARIYSSLVSSPVMQFLSGKERRDVEEIPLLISDFDKTFSLDETVFKLMPLDISVNLEDYAAVDKNFSSIITMFSSKARQHFSNNELEVMRARFENLKEKLSAEGVVTTSLRDEELYRTASEMTFGKNKREPYFAFGYVKITDKLTETVSFAPVCLVRAKLDYSGGNFFVKQQGKPIVNKVFIRNALRDSALGYDSFMKALMPTDKKEIFDLFENIRMALSETDDRHIYEIIKEAHLVNIDIDDYILWSGIALERNKLSSNATVNGIFSGAAVSESVDREYVPVKQLSSDGMRAVCSNTDVVVEGVFTEEKEKTVSSSVLRNITEGKSTLIVTDDMEMSEYVERVLSKDGIEDMVCVVDENCMASLCAKKVSENVEKYSLCDEIEILEYPEELFEARRVLADYTQRVNKQSKFGMSLDEAVEAYLGSCNGTENYDDVYVNKAIFADADEAKVGEIFETVGTLISNARNVCKMSGLEKHTPLMNHPLYHTNPKKDMDDNTKNKVCIAIESALPVISEYRDVFSDVNEILGFDEKELDSLYKLEKLNDLYKLVLTARDVDIPEKFVESDIEDFSRTKRFEAETRKRMEAIEFKLNFFSKEIFEDVENLLVREELEDDGEKGFLKKFIVKKNSQDLLMQYVDSGRKSDFQQHKIADIYKLLHEYKECMFRLNESTNGTPDDEETSKLAKISEKASYLVDAINSNKANNARLLSNVFRLISVIPIDASLARRITVARARFAELYSGEYSHLNVVSGVMGLSFDDVVFESGALSFDGLGKYLQGIEDNIEIADVWADWKEKSSLANEILPHFVKYIDEHGACSNVDRIFARSLLLPIAESVREESMKGFSEEKLARAKDKYIELITSAGEISGKNVLGAYMNSVKKIASEMPAVNPGMYEKTSFIDYYTNNASLVKTALPVIVVTKNILSEVLPLDAEFDTVIAVDNKNNGYTMLPALCFGKRSMLVNMSRTGRSELCAKMSKKVPVYNVSSIVENRDISLFTWLNSGSFGEKVSCINSDNTSNVEVVRMTGTYDRTTTRTNMTEAEHSMVKASSLLQDGTKRVALTAFTKEQCTNLERLLHLLSKKNKVLAQARLEGRVAVCTPDRLYMKQYDSLVVSACFGADKEARIGWDFGYAGIGKDEPIPEAYLCIADRKTEKTYILTSLNVKDSRIIRRSGKNAAIFNSFCEMLSDGRIPVNMSNAKLDREDSILCSLMSSIVMRNPLVMPCEGKNSIANTIFSGRENGPYALVDADKNMSMHDELLIKSMLDGQSKVTTTLTPMSLTGQKCKETVKSLANDRDNI
ncbi:MAG: hypothetical protein J6E38_09090 [Clostridia bacterium]|nr:hypothetical protein [Clostridia bacterium]